MTESQAGKRRPGGRTARTRSQVHAAVRALLGEGKDTPSVREVSERSGVHEVTIYRRWGSIESLILDVAVTQLNDESPFPNSGDLRRDILDWANSVTAQVKTHVGFALFRALAMARSALYVQDGTVPTVDATTYLRRRMDQIQIAIDRHEALHGGSAPTVEMIFDIVLAPIYLRAVFGYSSPDFEIEALVDRALQSGS
ncbi:AcrR family transcriptional regulator [Mycolicibacterium sp. 624]